MKVGDYVRTKDGIIDKVIIEYNGHCANPNCNLKHVSCKRNYYDEHKIVKSSPNIIDLIEENDLIHYEYYGIEATSNVYSEKGILILGEDEDGDEITLNDIEIKSIVTHEQFENMEYRIGD